MQDEHFMRSWNTGHRRFSADVGHRLSRLSKRFSARARHRETIGDPYGIPAKRAAGLGSGRARTSLHGLAATALTVALWTIVLALATPAPGLAAANLVATADCECLAHPPLA